MDIIIKTILYFITIFISIFTVINGSSEYTALINGKKIVYKSKYYIDEDTIIDEGEYFTTIKGETVFLVVNSATLTLGPNVIVTKVDKVKEINKEEEEIFNEYGINSAIVVIGLNSKAIINNSRIETDSYGGNGLLSINFAEIHLNEGKIITNCDFSRGLFSINEGRIYADSTEIQTRGILSPCIDSGINFGMIIANGIKMFSFGEKSPLIYSRGEINLFGCRFGESNKSPICIVEGTSSTLINNCELKCNINEKGEDIFKTGILIFQGVKTRKEGMIKFKAENSNLEISESLNRCNIPMLFVANSVAEIALVNTEVLPKKCYFLLVSKNLDSGIINDNGGKVDLLLTGVPISGKVNVDKFSSVNIKYDLDEVISNLELVGNNITTEKFDEK